MQPFIIFQNIFSRRVITLFIHCVPGAGQAKGEKGDQGEKGDRGQLGPKGDSGSGSSARGGTSLEKVGYFGRTVCFWSNCQ